MSATLLERKEREYIEGLAARFNMWRLREGKSYFSMPSSLWDEALTVARAKGLSHTSRALGLNRDELKRRLEQVPVPNPTPSAAAIAATAEEAQLIELPGVAQALLAAPPPPTPSAEAPIAHSLDHAVVEIVAVDGARLTVRVPAAQLNIAVLVQEFRGGACSR